MNTQVKVIFPQDVKQKFLNTRPALYQRSTPKEDVPSTLIESIEFCKIKKQEADRTAAFFKANGYDDIHGSATEGTDYVLINGMQRIYPTHKSDITKYLIVEGGQEFVTATHYSYSKSKQAFEFSNVNAVVGANATINKEVSVQ